MLTGLLSEVDSTIEHAWTTGSIAVLVQNDPPEYVTTKVTKATPSYVYVEHAAMRFDRRLPDGPACGTYVLTTPDSDLARTIESQVRAVAASRAVSAAAATLAARPTDSAAMDAVLAAIEHYRSTVL